MRLPPDLDAAIAKLRAGVSFDELNHDEQRSAMTATSVHVVDNMFALINDPNGLHALEWARQLSEPQRDEHAKLAWTAEMLGEPVKIGDAACLVLAQVAAGKYQLDAFMRRAGN